MTALRYNSLFQPFVGHLCSFLCLKLIMIVFVLQFRQQEQISGELLSSGTVLLLAASQVISTPQTAAILSLRFTQKT